MGLEDSGTRNLYLQIVFESNLFVFYIVWFFLLLLFLREEPFESNVFYVAKSLYYALLTY